VAISAEVVDELTAAGIDPSRIHGIPNAVDTSRFRPASAEHKWALRCTLGLPQTAQVIVYTGRLVSYKGLPLLLEVWPGLLAAHPDALLLFVGTGGLDIHACEAQLRAAVRDQGLDNSVHFTGSVDNVVDFLQAADVFVFPTENDVFPSSVVEAMACGLPLVTTPVGAIKEIIDDGRNGLLIAPRDGNALSRTLHRLLGDRELAARLGEGALQTVLERYSAMHVTHCYGELFRRLVDHA
jgi:glycosyltransferase involved in cell wall biosynthesis